MKKNDGQLITDYLSGDDNAITVLIDRHLKAVFNFTYRLVRKQEDADDITQETFLKMWRSLKKYRQGEHFKAWLFTIARNTAIDLMRKRKSLAFSVFENDEGENALTESLTDTEPISDEIFAKAEEKERLENALTKLSPVYRETLLLYYGKNFTFDQIGKILSKSLNTIKSRHRRAVMELRKYKFL